MESVFHIDTDIECRVLHYGKEVCIVSPGEDGTIHLRKGHHKLTFISKENPADQLTITYEVPENDIEDYIEVRLLPIRDERLAREAEEREIAKEAELLRKQKELEERKRIEEEKERNRKAEEAERRRREDEIRFAEERRKDEERINALIPIRYQQFLDSSKTHFHYIISRKDTSIDNHTQHYVRRGCKYNKYKNMASHTIPGLGGGLA